MVELIGKTKTTTLQEEEEEEDTAILQVITSLQELNGNNQAEIKLLIGNKKEFSKMLVVVVHK